MKIVSKTKAERRRDVRFVIPPITIELDGKPYVTSEWSLGGFSVNGYTGKRGVDEVITTVLTVNARQGTLTHRVKAGVVRIDPETQKLAAKFVGIDGDTIETLDGWLTGRHRRRAIA